jgi:hypothetical protein
MLPAVPIPNPTLPTKPAVHILPQEISSFVFKYSKQFFPPEATAL